MSLSFIFLKLKGGSKMKKVQVMVKAVKFTAKKFAPEILLGAGIVGVGVSTVLACKATLKVEGILDIYEETMDKIDTTLEKAEAGELVGAEYYLADAKKDKLTVKTQTVVEFAKVYGPAVTLMGVSIGCILGAHRIMSQRQVALMAAYKVVEEAFATYRGRVVKELGAEKDGHFMYGTKTVSEEETITDENGKKKKVTKEREELVPGAKLSGFARLFGPEQPDQMGAWTGSTQWSPIHEYNIQFLEGKEKYFNDKLIASGDIVMNEIFEEIGIPKTEAGKVSGWKYKSENGDGYISFAPRGIDGNWVFGKDGDSIVLDFNIDGIIFDQDVARQELK
jgi:hypothetical protein